MLSWQNSSHGYSRLVSGVLRAAPVRRHHNCPFQAPICPNQQLKRGHQSVPCLPAESGVGGRTRRSAITWPVRRCVQYPVCCLDLWSLTCVVWRMDGRVIFEAKRLASLIDLRLGFSSVLMVARKWQPSPNSTFHTAILLNWRKRSVVWPHHHTSFPPIQKKCGVNWAKAVTYGPPYVLASGFLLQRLNASCSRLYVIWQLRRKNCVARCAAFSNCFGYALNLQIEQKLVVMSDESCTSYLTFSTRFSSRL